MPEYDYYVVIRNTVKKIKKEKNTKTIIKVTGMLTCTFSEYDLTSDFPMIPTEKSFSLEFDPLIILGDLRNKEQAFEYLTEKLNNNESRQFLSGSYEYEYGFRTPLYIGNDEQYLKFVYNLDKMLQYNECTTLENLEQIQKDNHLNLDYNISVETENVAYELLQKKHRHATEKIYKPLEYKFGKTNNELKPKEYMKQSHQFTYHCHTMADVIFSILHFIVLHKYEFKTCALCQKKYAQIPNHGQGKYCPRKSPLSLNSYFDNNMNQKFIDLDCQESMKKFHEIMRNMKKNKLTYIKKDEQRFPFENEFDKRNDKIKNDPTINNLIELYSFTKNYKIDT